VLTNKKREGINSFVCAVSLYVAETPKASIKDHEPHYPKYLSALSRTVLLDNLSRNSCIRLSYNNHGSMCFFFGRLGEGGGGGESGGTTAEREDKKQMKITYS